MSEASPPRVAALELRARPLAAAALLALVPAALALGPVVDNDLGFHLRTGAWILEHRALPHVDPFSQQGLHRAWVAYSWLAEVLLRLLEGALGLRGVELFRVALAALIGLAIWRLARARAANVESALVPALLAALALRPALTERPWLFSILGVALVLDAVLRLLDGSRKQAWYLLAVFALWANLHVQFVYGLALLGLGTGAAWLERRPSARHLALLTAGGTLATLLNPAGPRLYVTLLGLMRQTQPFHLVAELEPPGFHDGWDWLVAALVLAAVLTLVLRRRRALFEPAVLLLASLLAARAERDTWFAAFAAVPILARWTVPQLTRWPSRSLAVEVGVASLALAAFLAGASAQTEALLRAEEARALPVDAVRFLERSGLTGPLYNDFNWGGFLIWRLPRLPVSMDGRTNLYTDAELLAHVRTWAGVARPSELDPALLRAKVVLAARSSPFTATLERDPAWKRVYQDALAEVFVRR